MANKINRDRAVEGVREAVAKLVEAFSHEESPSLVAEREDGWVSVEERLPEPLQEVLCFVVRRKKMSPQSWIALSHYSSEEGGGWYIEDQSGGNPRVTHWRALPLPPAGEETRK